MQLCKVPYATQILLLSFQSRTNDSWVVVYYFGQVGRQIACSDCPLESCCADLAFTLSSSCRYAHPGHPTAGYPAHAGQRAAALLLCLLHFRHRRRPALGRPPPEPLFCGRHLPFVSACSTWQFFFYFIFLPNDVKSSKAVGPKRLSSFTL